ncbi:hypothetical protein JH25_03865 [Pseudomonas sp. BRG-100]|nr:hypothetical protein JH25_03865 [Pseudomonas sp. BRG-100]OPB05879.1 hypothetical protein BFW89_09605 [Pseudomonas synxantha]
MLETVTDASVSREVPPSLAHYFTLQALASLYFVFLPAILLAYMVLIQAVKGYYIRKFGWQ